ncbi:MoaD/ThiS family protein [Galbibacter sp. BG1]|uniref:MoaD/ThiS family protein n=1 Tax=Galbibacter sp. BG1 TaxID=1170699 RepID=UPI0015BEFB1E|nr:MoaD/ThiS family protein [Galbibacter sp. BG1]QLE00778.1 MoaD/ThiS family protein [Galbibacter sp. BG1]
MNILMFGVTKEIVGTDSLYVAATEKVKNVADLKTYLKGKYPELDKLSSLAIAVNSKYAKDDDRITIDDEIALIPPVSGG